MKVLALLLVLGCGSVPELIDDNSICPVVGGLAIYSVVTATHDTCAEGAEAAARKYAAVMAEVASGGEVEGCRLVQRLAMPEHLCTKTVEVSCGGTVVSGVLEVWSNGAGVAGHISWGSNDGCTVEFRAVLLKP